MADEQADQPTQAAQPRTARQRGRLSPSGRDQWAGQGVPWRDGVVGAPQSSSRDPAPPRAGQAIDPGAERVVPASGVDMRSSDPTDQVRQLRDQPRGRSGRDSRDDLCAVLPPPLALGPVLCYRTEHGHLRDDVGSRQRPRGHRRRLRTVCDPIDHPAAVQRSDPAGGSL